MRALHKFRFITQRKLRHIFKAIRLYYMRNRDYQLRRWCISQESILYTNATKKILLSANYISFYNFLRYKKNPQINNPALGKILFLVNT